MTIFYLMFFIWMHVAFYWKGLGNAIEGLCTMDGGIPTSLRKMGRNSICNLLIKKWKNMESY